QWNEDRTGRLVLFGLVFAVSFLLVAAALWWASDARTSDALANGASPSAPFAGSATAVTDADPAGAASTLPLSPYPLPAQGIVMSDAPQTVPSATVAGAPTAPPDTR